MMPSGRRVSVAQSFPESARHVETSVDLNVLITSWHLCIRCSASYDHDGSH
jgi:hypothetical protein